MTWMRVARRRQARSAIHSATTPAAPAAPARWCAVIRCRERYSSGAGERKL
mgnify:CR=1 FL=1